MSISIGALVLMAVASSGQDDKIQTLQKLVHELREDVSELKNQKNETLSRPRSLGTFAPFSFVKKCGGGGAPNKKRNNVFVSWMSSRLPQIRHHYRHTTLPMDSPPECFCGSSFVSRMSHSFRSICIQ